MKPIVITVLTLALAVGVWLAVGPDAVAEEPTPAPASERLEKAWFAGGCFWCTESDFEAVPGVAEARSGYAGGRVDDPSYEQVSAGGTGHAEAVEVLYDPEAVSYEELLDVFWHSVDPTDAGGQFCDRGSQYRTAIFVATPEQRQAAEASKAAISGSKPFDAPIVTGIETFDRFWPAEEYHQDYAKKNPLRYNFYRRGCGRDARLESLWGDDAFRH